MACDETMADRVLAAVADEPDVSTRKMFGGFAVMLRGNMLAGVMGDDLMARVGPDAYEELLREPGAREMEFTGRPMRGMIIVDAEAVSEDEDLDRWLERCQMFVGALKPK